MERGPAWPSDFGAHCASGQLINWKLNACNASLQTVHSLTWGCGSTERADSRPGLLAHEVVQMHRSVCMNRETSGTQPNKLFSDRSSKICLALLAMAAYFLLGKLSLRLALVHPSATAVWIPTGASLAAFLLLGYEIWPGVFFGAFLVNLTTAGSFATSMR